MSPQEFAWRVRSAVRDATDRYRIPLQRRPRPVSAILADGRDVQAPGFRVCDMLVGEWADQPIETVQHEWCDRLLTQARSIAAHRLSFFDLKDCDLGQPIDWNRDHKFGKSAPMRFAASIDYRDFNRTGDCKLVWEPNRHHQLVVLGRAYRASGDPAYAAEVVAQLDSWLRQCPFGIGMNWRSPLELGIRLINWVWALDLIAESGLVCGEFRQRLLRAVHQHVWEIARKYSRSSSANNHVIGEAAGVYIACGYFTHLRNAAPWRAQARRILCEQILRQTYPDGGTREQAVGYQMFVMQFFLLAALTGRSLGEEFPPSYWERLERMCEFLAALSEGGPSLPMFGDCDDGYVLDLGGRAGDPRPLLSIAAILYKRADFKARAGSCRESARWLLGRDSHGAFEAIASTGEEGCMVSRAFPGTGYYLLQHGRQGSHDGISAVFDCGELGFGPLAAHGHADALSFTLRAFGTDILVDPGTYDYFSYPQWRQYFRCTRAHNTLMIDDLDQSVMLGPFLWGQRAGARCLLWEPSAVGGKVVGEHNGYARLKDPVIHRRSMELDGPAGSLTIRDEIIARESHEVDVFFHLAEHCQARLIGGNRYQIVSGGQTVTMELDPRLSVRMLTAAEDPIGGWVSRGYHHRAPSTTLAGHCSSCGGMVLVHRIHVDPAGSGATVSRA